MINQIVCPYNRTARKSKKNFYLILLTFIFCVIAGNVHASDSAFERIKHSLPQREAGWKTIETDGPNTQSDGSKQASFLWFNGLEEVSANIILHKSVKAAKRQFKRSHKDDPWMDSFLIDGIGDEAYLFPPIILNQDGPFNLRFRKGQHEIWMNAKSQDMVKRCAQYIIDSISEPDKSSRPRR